LPRPADIAALERIAGNSGCANRLDKIKCPFEQRIRVAEMFENLI
jgi:hypothetical protein